MIALDVRPGIGFIDYIGTQWKLRVRAERYDDEGYAELSFFLRDGTGENLLHPTRINLLATPSMNSLAKRLERNSTEIPWTDILAYVAGKTIEIARRGEPVKAIGKKPETMKVEYQLFPILERNEPTTIYSPGGYAKSYLAAYIACIVRFGGKGFSNWTPTPGNVLYLDWESSSQDHERRVWAIKQGLGIETEETFSYLFCHQPLAADIHRIQSIIAEGDIALLIIDSQMAAEGYGPHPAQVSSQYYNALRSLHCTSLTLDHVSKAEWGKVADDDSLGPYGSVVKFNRSRSQFEIKKSQTAGEDFMELALIHRKHNEGKLLKPIGIRIDFHSNGDDELDKVTFKACEISDNPDLSKVQSLRDRLAGILAAGTMVLKDLAEAVDKPEATVRSTLYRYKDTFVKVGQEWGLKAYE
ncbi:MAG: hypothetical protein A2Z75_08375 [Chloroflexi bacterium RBG_13_50_10]|nr:MAG: hypothetical protein A2Z75_08375 [Chloroflexi bacterium RBG_13_50_10]